MASAALSDKPITYEKAVGDTSIQELTELVAAEYRGRGNPQYDN